MITQHPITLITDDQQHIIVWKISPTTAIPTKNIFLSHGAFSDKHICLAIAEYFTQFGFTILEWRGHGSSPKTKQDFNFETIAQYDFKAVFDYFKQELKIHHIHCI